MAARFDYILGDHTREAARLRAQARLWDPVSCALFDRLAIRTGSRVLEVGPGQGSLHLELRRRVGGTVDAVTAKLAGARASPADGGFHTRRTRTAAPALPEHRRRVYLSRWDRGVACRTRDTGS